MCKIHTAGNLEVTEKYRRKIKIIHYLPSRNNDNISGINTFCACLDMPINLEIRDYSIYSDLLDLSVFPYIVISSQVSGTRTKKKGGGGENAIEDIITTYYYIL